MFRFVCVWYFRSALLIGLDLRRFSVQVCLDYELTDMLVIVLGLVSVYC